MITIFGLDDGFAMQGGVAIASIDRFLTSSDRVVVFHNSMGADRRQRVAECARTARIDFIDCTGMLHPAWVPPGHVTSATYLRFLAAELLSDEPRCLYLDGDVIVRRSPAELLDLDIDTTLAAVQSRVAPYVASPGGVKHWFELGLTGTAPHFNAGMLLMDLERWRDLRVTQRLTTFLDAYGDQIELGDQEAMNAVLAGDWTPVDRTWNYITHVTESFMQTPELEPPDPHIVHFAGRSKPWSFDRKPIYSEEWYQVLESTPWKGWRPERPTPPGGPKAVIRRFVRRGLDATRTFVRDPS
jgi:lipopolysaccharide biosynthesis glycosyltransferase